MNDLEIAQAATLRPIREIAAKLDLDEADLHTHGRWIAKLDHGLLRRLEERPKGRLVLVTAISPTPAGEGKTTTTVGLGDGLRRIGEKAIICVREPSLGPCFGMKGGATGGGYAQVMPMEPINLHFTGDFHAIGSANNLLAAMIDNHIYWDNQAGLDPRRIAWRRVVDMNDRALRQIVNGLGGIANGAPREDGFDITVASEVMAIFCLARDMADLEARLGRIVVGQRRDRTNVTAAEMKASGAMAALLRDALQPNLVQTLEGNPALIHGGPFANIAHGCNSVIATKAGLALGDWVVTEAGFGADLGAEKFIDIKCRSAGLAPAAAVLVATVRALKMHGGVAKNALAQQDVEAVRRGLPNLERHIGNLRRFGVPVVVAVNHFVSDSEAEFEVVRAACAAHGVEAFSCKHWAQGSAGIEPLARKVVSMASHDPSVDFLYPLDMPLLDKIRHIATTIYGASDIAPEASVTSRLKELEAQGFGHLPICMAKTQYSFTTDATRMGAPTGHVIPIRQARLSAGAGFVVAVCGDIMTMPGLPRTPAADTIGLDKEGRIVGLF